MRDKTGKVLSGPKEIAKALNEHWTGVTTPPPTKEARCDAYLQSLNIPSNILAMTSLLYRPLSRELVKEERLNKQSAPGKDGYSTRIYSAFQNLFIDQMLQIVENSLQPGKLPEGWDLGIIDNIPKTAGPATISKLRPIALQDIKKNGL